MTGTAHHPDWRAPAMAPAPLTEQLDERLFGGKAAQLSVAARAGLPVPRGFALTAAFVDAAAAGRDEARRQISDALRQLHTPVAVRSSAIGEDSEQASFAGQHLTLLNLQSVSETIDAVYAVWESAHSPSALAYRKRLGLPEEPQIAVVVQECVNADVAGVLFSRNPLNGSDDLMIEAAWGLGEAVVSGLVIPDRFRLARNGAVIEKAPGRKSVAVRMSPGGGTVQAAVRPDLARALCLDDVQLAALYELALRCDSVFAGNHDIEWAFAGGLLAFLQRRTLTATTGLM